MTLIRKLEPVYQTIGKNSTPYDTTNALHDPRRDCSLPGRKQREIHQ